MAQQDIQISVPIIGVGSSPVAYADQILDEGTNMTLDEVAKKSVVYGPYASVAAAHTALSADGLNTVGTTVGISGSNNTVVEYWYQGGTAQENLVEKSSGGGGSEQIQSDWNQTDSTKKDFIKNKPNIPDTSDYYTKSQSDEKYQPAGNYQPAGDYATKTELNGKVDKVSGKGLSTNDYTNEDKAKVAAAITEHQDISGKVDKIAGKGLSTNDYTNAEKQKVGNALVPADIAGKANASDVYTKSETYTKTEVNGLVDTPHQEYVTVDVYSNLPATGSKDTIYRVSNYNGSTSQVDASVYSEYAWNGTQYIFLCVKSQIGEVFDISVYNNNAKYANLAAALNGGANIPQSLQKGGMSIKFVQSSDNKYVQYRLMNQSFSVNVDDWYNDYTSFLQTVGDGIITSDKYIGYINGVQSNYPGLMFVTKGVTSGMKLKYKSIRSNPDNRGLAFYDVYDKFIEGYQMLPNEQDIIVPNNAVVCRATVETTEQLLIISTNEAISIIVKKEKELGLDNFPQIFSSKTGNGVATTDADVIKVDVLRGNFLVGNTLSIVVNSDCFTQIYAYGVSAETSSWTQIGIFKPNKLTFFTLEQNFKTLGFYVFKSNIIQNGNYNYQVYAGEIATINSKLEGVTGLINGTITKSYEISDFPSEQQNYYLDTSGNIGDIFNPNPNYYQGSNTFWAKIILPKQSKLLFHSYKSTGNVQDLVITNFENVIKQKISYDNINDDEIILTDDCIVYVTQASTRNDALLTITYNSDCFSLIGRLLQIENLVGIPEDYDKLEPVSEIPLTKINQHPGFASIFHNWGFIGDSLSSGEIEVKYQGVDTYYDNYDFSWGQALCRLCGTQGYNFSQGGEYAKGWCQGTNERSWSGAQTNIKDCYIIALGVNDIGHLDDYYTAGIGNADTDIDVLDYNNNADSIIGWYGSIIQRLKTIQPKTKIFVTCLPKPVKSTYHALNIEIRKLTTIFTDVYVFDLEKYAPSFSGEWDAQYRDAYHLKATGYQWYAWLIASYLDWYVRSYPEEFANVPLIGTQYERRD